MGRVTKWTNVLVLLSVVLILLITVVPLTSVAASGSRFSGSVAVPTWNKGDKWGYKIPQYAYSSSYYGVGFEVMGTETVNGYECYKVKIWWDAAYGSTEENYEMDMEIPGFFYSYKYLGYAYFTKEKLAIAKFTNELEMRTKFDGAAMSAGYTTRAIEEPDIGDYTQYLEKMKSWKYDISYAFKITYDYDPPFVIYDYPLEANKKWESTSVVTINWDYSTKIYMNDAMKKDIEEMYGGSYTGIDATDEEGSDSTQFTLTGIFEITGEDTITTDTGSHSVFIIDYDISVSYTRGTRAEPPESYGGMSVPGGDATIALIGGSSGSGKSYFDPESGYAQKMEPSGYFSETYTTVNATSVEDSYNNLDTSSSSGKDGDEGIDILLIIALVVGITIAVVVVLVIVLVKKMNRYEYQQYPDQYQYQNQSQYPDQRYPSQQPQQHTPYPPQNPPQRPPQTPPEPPKQ